MADTVRTGDGGGRMNCTGCGRDDIVFSGGWTLDLCGHWWHRVCAAIYRVQFPMERP